MSDSTLVEHPLDTIHRQAKRLAARLKLPISTAKTSWPKPSIGVPSGGTWKGVSRIGRWTDIFNSSQRYPSRARRARISWRSAANRFLQETVLPQFGRVPGARHTRDAMAQAAARWLASRDGDALEVAYDYSMDFSLLERLLASSDGPALSQLVPVHVGYLLGDPLGEEAAVASWSATDKLRGLRRHHALADAWALKARFEAVHGV